MKTGGLVLSDPLNANTADPLQKIGSISLIQQLIVTFRLAGVRPIVIIVPEEEQGRLQKDIAYMGVTFLQAPAGCREPFDAIRTGLSHLLGQCEQVLVTPVDIPLFSVDTVKALLDAGTAPAIPVLGGRHGHPLLLPADLIPAIIDYQGPGDLPDAVRACGQDFTQVEVGDSGIHIHSSQLDNEKITALPRKWRPVLKLRIARETPFLGPGSWQLLSLIETTGSVRLASQQMGISYSKAWKVLDNLETQAGFPILIRQPGGKNGGETCLTGPGRQLLETFERFERECTQAVHTIFEKYFGAEEEL